MRIIPLLTALIVTAVLYGLVFQRDALLAFARGEEAESLATGEGEATDEEAPGIGVLVRRSKAVEIDSAVVLRGQTQADRQVEVRAETSAVVISEPLRKGSFVENGALLCELDPGTRQASLDEARARLTEARTRVPEAQARLAEAEARLTEANINDNAAQRLSEGGFAADTRVAATAAAVQAAQAGLASAQSGLQTAQATIQSAAASVAAAQREIERLQIRAPFEGFEALGIATAARSGGDSE